MTVTLPLLGLALLAFAANSLLCREGLASGASDPLAFTAVHLLTGALVLVVLQLARGGLGRCQFDVRAIVALCGYAAFFSLAYVALDAGTGALLLFAQSSALIPGGVACVIVAHRDRRPLT